MPLGLTREDDARFADLKKKQAALMARINARRKAKGQVPIADIKAKRDQTERARHEGRHLAARAANERRVRGAADPLSLDADDRNTSEIARLSKEVRAANRDRIVGRETDQLVETLQRKFRNDPGGLRAMEEQSYQRGFVNRVRSREYGQYNRSFLAYLRGGRDHLDAQSIVRAHADYKAMSVRLERFQGALHTESNASGGFMIPEEIEYTLDRLLSTISIMRQLATVRGATAATLKKYFNMTGTDAGWVGEREARPETNTPVMKELEYPIQELYANPRMTQTMLDDAGFSVEAWLTEELNTAFEEMEGEAFINGDGFKKPWGLIGGYEKVANATFSAAPATHFGKWGYTISGAAAAFDSSNPADRLVDLHHALRPAFRANANYVMNDLTAAVISKFKDGQGQYLWKDKIADDHDGTLNGKAVMIDERFPNIGADQYPIAFGDFAKAYLILDRFGMRTLRDEYTAKPWVQFYTTKRLMGGAYNFEALKLLKIATS
jgi:HK97 family phage major capsid protein